MSSLPLAPIGALLAAALTASLLPLTPAPAAARAASSTASAVPDAEAGFQTSERVRGPAAAPRIAVRRTPRTVTEPTGYTLASGVRYSTWSQVDDPAREPYTVHLLRVNLPGNRVRMDLLADSAAVGQRRTVRSMVAREGGAVAGINGDFFDIADTGAPLGNSMDTERRLVGARRRDWTRTFWIDSAEVPHIGRQHLVASLVQHPQWEISHFNSPTVWPDRIGIYTPAWGRTSGARVTDGRTARVREVIVRGGRVVANRRTLSTGTTIRGRLLIGRGQGADRLARLRVGSRIGLRWRLRAAQARVAISGSHILLSAGQVQVSDDVELHPRTAIGIDRDTGRLLLVTVDGRSESSSGATLLELARLMRQVGAEDALNLDGGGSSTMVGWDQQQTLRVLNDPSDGRQRPVPNGLVVFASPAG